MLLVLTTTLLSSCSKDDEDTSSSLSFDKSTTVGTWEITEVNGTSPWRWVAKGNNIVFNSNGYCTTEFSMENAWKIEGGKIKTFYKETNEPMLIYTLVSKEDNTYNVRIIGTLDESNLSILTKMRKK